MGGKRDGEALHRGPPVQNRSRPRARTSGRRIAGDGAKAAASLGQLILLRLLAVRVRPVRLVGIHLAAGRRALLSQLPTPALTESASIKFCVLGNRTRNEKGQRWQQSSERGDEMAEALRPEMA